MNLEIQINKLKYAKDKKRNAVLGWVDCDFILAELEKKDKEIERLNNIINELEFYLVSGTREKPYFRGSLYWNEACEDVLEKLRELKGDSDKE